MTLIPSRRSSVPGVFSSPFNSFDSISLFNSKELNNVFEQFDKVFADFDRTKAFGVQASPVPCDIFSVKDDEGKEIGLELRYAVAGYDKNDLNVYLSPDSTTLNISVVHLTKTVEENKNICCLAKGIKKSNWSVSYRIGTHVNKEKISSQFKDGILSVKVPYFEENKEKQVNKTIVIE